MHVCMHEHSEAKRRVLDPLKQELVVAVSCLMWVLNSGLSKKGCTLTTESSHHSFNILLVCLHVLLVSFYFFVLGSRYIKQAVLELDPLVSAAQML